MSTSRRKKPRYLQLAEHFIERIASGDYPVGGLLPTELEICESFSVSRQTARVALSQLTAAGLVSRRPGAGTRVLMPREAMRYQHEVDTIEDLLQYGNQTRLELRSARREAAEAGLASQLGIVEGAAVLLLQAVRLEADSRLAIAWTDIAIPVASDVPTERLLNLQTAPRAIAHLLNPADLTRVEQIFDAARLPATAAKALGQRSGGPAMRVTRHYRGSDGRVLAYAVSLHPAGQFAYRIVLSRRGS